MKNLLSNLRLGAIFGLLGIIVIQQTTIRKASLALISARKQLDQDRALLMECAEQQPPLPVLGGTETMNQECEICECDRPVATLKNIHLSPRRTSGPPVPVSVCRGHADDIEAKSLNRGSELRSGERIHGLYSLYGKPRLHAATAGTVR